MGVEIECVVQKKVDGSWTTVEILLERQPFPPLYNCRAIFDLLAGAGMKIGSPESPFGPPRGLPADDTTLAQIFPLAAAALTHSEICDDAICSWLLSEELLNFNYDTPVEILIPGYFSNVRYLRTRTVRAAQAR